MLTAEKFLELINENKGFEVALGFRNDVDHYIGGTGNKFWYLVQKGTKQDYYLCTLDGSEQTDVQYSMKKKVLTSKPAPAGKTMEMILAELAVGQKEIEDSGRKPVTVEVSGHPCSHYSFAFGERAYKVADEYGVTIEYSNLKEEEAGFRLRNIVTGKKVKVPKES